MDTFAGLCGLHRCGHLFSNATIHRSSIARENRVRCLLFGRHHMFIFLVCFSHNVLSFGNCWQTIFKVRAYDIYIITPKMINLLETLFFLSSNRLDYCGIALLIMGSFVPWVYYGFYCHYEHKLIYLSVVMVLGMASIIVSLFDTFSDPNLRPLRAGKFTLYTFNNHCIFIIHIRNISNPNEYCNMIL